MGQTGAPPLPYLSTRKPGRYAFKLLCRWDGSVYKLVWRNLLVWLAFYYALSFWYRFGMSEEQRRVFESVCAHCENHNSHIAVTFFLGFYVTTVLNRWWVHWDNLPWPDSEAFWLSSCIRGEDDQSRLLRRTVMRYLALSAVYTKCLLSTRVRKRYPTMDHFVEAGLMNENERKIMESVSDGQKLFYLPTLWAGMLISRARDEKKLTDLQWQSCMYQINDFRAKCSRSLIIEVQNVPVVYSQIAAWAVYAFSAICLLGRQSVRPVNQGQEQQELDTYFPVLTVIQVSHEADKCEGAFIVREETQLIFTWGWLKVAEAMIDPYGEDDADFPLNAFIDRNLMVSYVMSDKAIYDAHFPDMVKYPYWDAAEPSQLPRADSERFEAKSLIMTGEDKISAAQVDGLLSDVPTSVASWRDQEEKAWLRNMRRSTFRRVLGGLHHRHGSAASKCHQLQRCQVLIKDQLKSPEKIKNPQKELLNPQQLSTGNPKLSPALENGLAFKNGNGKTKKELAWTARVMTSSMKSGINASAGGFSSEFGFDKIEEESTQTAPINKVVKRAETFTLGKSSTKEHHNWANFNNSPTGGRKSASSGAIPSKNGFKYLPVGPDQQSNRPDDREPSLITCWDVKISSGSEKTAEMSACGEEKCVDEELISGDTLTFSDDGDQLNDEGKFHKTWPVDDS